MDLTTARRILDTHKPAPWWRRILTRRAKTCTRCRFLWPCPQAGRAIAVIGADVPPDPPEWAWPK